MIAFVWMLQKGERMNTHTGREPPRRERRTYNHDVERDR